MRVFVGDTDTGRSCPYCRFPLKASTSAEQCEVCGAMHHEDCWNDGGGCAVHGCANNSANATQQMPGPPPQQAPSQPLQPQAPIPAMSGKPNLGYQQPPPPQPPAKRKSTQIIALVAVVAIVGGGIGAFGASQMVGSSDESSASATEPADTDGGSSLDSESEDDANSVAMDQRQVRRVLSRYERAYSNHDTSGLSAIMTPGVRRRGLAAGGCVISNGRNAVLEDYESQFAGGSGTYELVDLSSSDIRVHSNRRASVNANYVISPGGSGAIKFSFASSGGEWRISRVYATCN